MKSDMREKCGWENVVDVGVGMHSSSLEAIKILLTLPSFLARQLYNGNIEDLLQSEE